jgi:hypothetical protein
MTTPPTRERKKPPPEEAVPAAARIHASTILDIEDEQHAHDDDDAERDARSPDDPFGVDLLLLLSPLEVGLFLLSHPGFPRFALISESWFVTIVPQLPAKFSAVPPELSFFRPKR